MCHLQLYFPFCLAWVHRAARSEAVDLSLQSRQHGIYQIFLKNMAVDNPHFPFAQSWTGSLLLYLLFNALDINTAQFFLAAPGMAWLPPCSGACSMTRAEHSPGIILLLFLSVPLLRCLWILAFPFGKWHRLQGFPGDLLMAVRIGGNISAEGVQG